MSRLLELYTKMLEKLLDDPERFGRPPLSTDEAKNCEREVALLRALTPDEAEVLLRDRHSPSRLPEVAVAVGLSEAHCRRVLAHAVWNLTEGLQPLTSAPPPRDG